MFLDQSKEGLFLFKYHVYVLHRVIISRFERGTFSNINTQYLDISGCKV